MGNKDRAGTSPFHATNSIGKRGVAAIGGILKNLNNASVPILFTTLSCISVNNLKSYVYLLPSERNQC